MAGVDITGGGGGISLTKDIYVNTSLVGPFNSTSDVDVFLQDPGGNPITPTSSVLVGNDLTITANIPVPSGVALQFPKPSQYTSYANGDTGWRFQNNFYDYTPPLYPSKTAELSTISGSANFFRLKTPLTVAGVTNDLRFVDINGIQAFSAVGNANAVVIDKLTGLMFTRNIPTPNQPWATVISNALSYSIILNSITYSDWYLIGLCDWVNIFGLISVNSSGGFIDPLSLITLCTFNTGSTPTSDTDAQNTGQSINVPINTTGNNFSVNNKGNNANVKPFYIHDARNLIS